MNTIQKKIVRQGIANLEEFGYDSVTEANIFTDLIYSQMFLSMLKENLGLGFDKDINGLIDMIKTDKE